MDEGTDDELLALGRSPDPADRIRAAEELARRHRPMAWQMLAQLLGDADSGAVAQAAASTLLGLGDRGWDLVLEAVWRSDDIGRSESLRAPFVDLLIAGEDVESALVRREQLSGSPSVQRGAQEMLIALNLRPVEYISDEDET